jgi:mono/diheme cytochrome c family protein
MQMLYPTNCAVRRNNQGEIMEILPKRGGIIITVLLLLSISLMLAGCGGGGGGGGVSSEVVSGVAAVGAPLAGEAKIKDSSNPTREKTTVIGSDGTFAFDVTDMKGPFILSATGSVDGETHTLQSFADKAGTANINPLANAAVANAGGVDDPVAVFENPDHEKLNQIKADLPGAIAKLMTKLRPLLMRYNAQSDDPITVKFKADHTRLDGLFDDVKITLFQGILTITNKKTGAVIYTGMVSDILNGNFDGDNLPNPGPVPDAPVGVTAAGGDGQVTVSWTSVGNATSYNIYWSVAPGVTKANGAKIAGAVSPYIHTGRTAATTYYYIVTAVNSAGEGVESAQASATTNATPPPPPAIPTAPTGIIATGGTKQATIAWTTVTGATSYNLYWSTTVGVTKANGTKITGVTSPAVHSVLTDSTTYYYIVTAANSSGESPASVQVAATTLTPTPPPTAPGAPTSVTAAGGAKLSTVSWAAVTGATSYNIYWSTTAGVTTANGTKIAGVTSPFVHTVLSDGTTYYYIVTAANNAGESSASAQVSATTNAPPPAVPNAPTGVSATGGAKQVSISWSSVSGSTSYNLYWSTASGVTTATGTKIAGATSPYVQSGLADGTAYYYVVTAANSAGESPASAQASATTNPPISGIDGAALYTQYCSGCHDPLGSSVYQGASAALITQGIANVSTMRTKFNATTGTQIKLTPEQIAAIAAALI